MLTLSSKIFLPIAQNEPNINPYWIIGGGPVLGIESDWNRQFPGSLTHAYSIGGYSTFTGPGLSYHIGSWFLRPSRGIPHRAAPCFQRLFQGEVFSGRPTIPAGQNCQIRLSFDPGF